MSMEFFTVVAKTIPVLATIISPLLVFIQTGVKNKATLLGLLSAEMAKDEPVAYEVEAYIARLHNCRPLPWFFLEKVLHFSHAFDIISLVSFGRRFLDVFELCETGQRFHFRYTPRFRGVWVRRITQWFCFGLAMLMLSFFAGCYWAILPLLFGMEGGSVTIQHETTRFMLNAGGMIFFTGMYHIFFVQFIVLSRADARLTKINALLAMNYPADDYK